SSLISEEIALCAWIWIFTDNSEQARDCKISFVEDTSWSLMMI
ncbi:10307_t:CDS:1, partial [Ambispora leptoticha]